jgi:hypothetical protein
MGIDGWGYASSSARRAKNGCAKLVATDASSEESHCRRQ